MTLTIKHIYKELGTYWDCQIDKLEKVASFTSALDDEGTIWLSVFFEDGHATSIQINYKPQDFDIIECTQ